MLGAHNKLMPIPLEVNGVCLNMKNTVRHLSTVE